MTRGRWTRGVEVRAMVCFFDKRFFSMKRFDEKRFCADDNLAARLNFPLGVVSVGARCGWGDIYFLASRISWLL